MSILSLLAWLLGTKKLVKIRFTLNGLIRQLSDNVKGRMTPKIGRIRHNNFTTSRQMDTQIGPTTLDLIGPAYSMHPLNYEGVKISLNVKAE